MRDGLNIGDMLVILAAAVLHPSPARAIVYGPFFSPWKWVSGIFRSCAQCMCVHLLGGITVTCLFPG